MTPRTRLRFFNASRVIRQLPFLLLLALSSCSSTSLTRLAQEAQKTPEATVRSYYDALNRRDMVAVQNLLVSNDASDNRFLTALRDQIAHGLAMTFRNVRIQVVEDTGQTARLRAGVDVDVKQADGSTKIVPGTDLFSAVKKGDRWYLVGLGDEFPPGWKLAPKQ